MTISAAQDPRRENLVEPFELPPISEDEAMDSSIYQFIGLMMGVMSILTSNRYSAWIGSYLIKLGLFFNLMGLLNQREQKSLDMARSGLSSISFSALSLFLIYNQLFNMPRGASVFSNKP